jgi:hypothetical protein
MASAGIPHRRDRATVPLIVGAALFGLPLMTQSSVVLVAALSSGRGAAGVAGVAAALVVLPALGALVGWGYARTRRYPTRKALRHTAIGSLVVSLPVDVVVVAMLVWMVVALGTARY